MLLVYSMQDVANAMLMFIEENHNGKTALTLSETFSDIRIIDDHHHQFRKEVLKVDDDDFEKILAAMQSSQSPTQ